MKNLIKGGIYSFHEMNQVYILIKELKHNEVLCFAVNSNQGRTRQEIVNILKAMTVSFTDSELRYYLTKMDINILKNSTDGFLGIISDKLLKKLEEI